MPERLRYSVERSNREESIAKAAILFNVNPKTIIKWKNREDTKDLPMKDLERLSKLMTIVAVAIVYASITGLTQEIAYKKTVRALFYSSLYSYFTRGLRWIKDKLLFFDFSDLLNYLKKSEGEYVNRQKK
ncbi:hypothetical protein HE1_00446 [Holospora elegans E1]|uniref:Uncharacterized protein n=1 Tax=Holospora elegans E1 TaxID=1427503 RepID=A0A023DXJ1_9PROT|nr:hypothetical protein HE1_00446 [Holospora elegans E1]